MDTILIVDSDSTSRAICKAHLSKKYKLVLTLSGLQALGYLKNNPPPDLILMDNQMPGLTGMEVLKILKEQDETKNIPVILESSVANVDFSMEGYRLGASELLLRPIIPILLLKRVEFVLHCRHLEMENSKLRKAVANLKGQLMRKKDQ